MATLSAVNRATSVLFQRVSQLLRQPANSALRQVRWTPCHVTSCGLYTSGQQNAPSCVTDRSQKMSRHVNRWQHISEQIRYSSYDAYPEYETPSPFRQRQKYRYGYRSRLYDGGPLPRPEGDYEDKPLPMPEYDPRKKDMWTTKKALFGQNDYIDILGDGTIHPYQLISAPAWLRGFRGNELQRLLRRMKFESQELKEFYPTKYHNMTKHMFFLYKKFNRRNPSNYFGRKKAARQSRLDKIKKHR